VTIPLVTPPIIAGSSRRVNSASHAWSGQLPLGPDSKWQSDAPFDVFQITDTDRNDLLDLRKILYIHGYVRYYDLFRVLRRTGFMFEYTTSRDAPEGGVFVMCPHSMWYDMEEQPES
jgi:hypothetical protein